MCRGSLLEYAVHCNLSVATFHHLCALQTRAEDKISTDFAQVYGKQPRWKKYAKRLMQRSPDARFEEVVEKLTELTQQAWSLQTPGDAGSASSRYGPTSKALQLASYQL